MLAALIAATLAFTAGTPSDPIAPGQVASEKGEETMENVVQENAVATEAAEGWNAEAAKDIIEQPVHLTVKRQQRMRVIAPVTLGADRMGEPVFLPTPGNEITNSHDDISFSGWMKG